MLDREKVIVAFEQKRTQFAAYTSRRGDTLQELQRQVNEFLRMDGAEVEAIVDGRRIAYPGARPTVEFDLARSGGHALRLPFGRRFENHQEARAWALEPLRDRAVAAVDGSQVTPTKDISIPVGAVQIGWYVNFHSAGGSYIKDLEFGVLSPDELVSDSEENDLSEEVSDEGEFPYWRVNQERFVRECDRLCELMETLADSPADRRPVCFFDGSFIISFAGHIRPVRAQGYVRAVEKMLRCSQETRVPLIGFVDTSFSHDLVTLIASATNGTRHPISDAGLMNQVLTEWGDRSPVFVCARSDSLTTDGRARFYEDVVFGYVKLARERPPVRVEFPRWMLGESDITTDGLTDGVTDGLIGGLFERGPGGAVGDYGSGLIDEVMDVIRAECIVGTGYPYVIETADALAVVSQEDRRRFYALFEQFATSAGMELTQTRKAASKESRR